MPIPGNAEPGAVSGQQSVNFPSSIPIKKRRFPIFRDEKPSISGDQDSKKRQESNIPDKSLALSDAGNTASPGNNSDASKTCAPVVKKEVVVTPTSMELEVEPSVSLGPMDDLRNKMGTIVSNPNSSVAESRVVAQTTNVKQEIVRGQPEGGTCKLKLSAGLMNVELSLGLKEPKLNPLEHHKKVDISDPSLLSLAISDKKNLVHDNDGGSAMDNVSRPVSSDNRSNWDLNTTMDVWEGSTSSDAFSHNRLADIGRLDKSTNDCNDEKSCLTIFGTVAGLSLNKGKDILDGQISKSSSNAPSLQPFKQGETDDTLGLRLAIPFRELVSTSVNPLNLQSAMKVINRTVKSEPADESSKRVYSVGSSNSSNMEMLKFGSVKREFAYNKSLLKSSVSQMKLSVKSELAPEDAVTPQFVLARVMQHQDSCASSSALPVPLMPQRSFPTRLPPCSELSTSNSQSNSQSERSFDSKELHDHQNYILDEQIDSMACKPDDKLSKPCTAGNSREEKINVSSENLKEDSLIESDFESLGKCSTIDPTMDMGEDICDREDEEYEDGEVREPLQHSACENPIEGKIPENLQLVEGDSRNLKAFLNVDACDFDEKDVVKENHDRTNKDSVSSVGYEPNDQDNPLHELSDKVLEEVGVDVKRSISVKLFGSAGRKDVEEPGNEISSDGIHVEPNKEATDKAVNDICLVENESTLSKVEEFESVPGHDAAKDSNNAGNKSRIINLSRASGVTTTPFKTRSIPNRLLTSRSGKEKHSDLDGDMPRGNRDEIYSGGSSKSRKDRVYDRNSRPGFMRGKGRVSGRFGSGHNKWGSGHDFASENSYDYRVARRKHASDVDIECNGYGNPQDSTAPNLGSNRRKPMNDEFPSLRRTSLRRLSPGERDGPPGTRNMQMMHRIPRNMSPNRCNDMMGLGHGEQHFMRRHLSDDNMVDPVYNRPQARYDELDGQILVRGNRNFSNMQRKGYPRVRSKSPVRSRTRSPDPWMRSPNEVNNQHRSPALVRMGRMRSPDRSFFHNEMIVRRRESPSYVARHPNDVSDEGSGRPNNRSANSNRRGSPPVRVFQTSVRRGDALNSREMGSDGGDDQYMNGPPMHSNKFRSSDGSIDERRKFIDRRGQFRPNYNGSGDNDNFRFIHPNDGPRPYRFCPDPDVEFVERSNMREREFDKHQSLVASRQVRNNMEEQQQQDGNFRRVWHDDDEFSVARGKRRRF